MSLLNLLDGYGAIIFAAAGIIIIITGYFLIKEWRREVAILKADAVTFFALYGIILTPDQVKRFLLSLQSEILNKKYGFLGPTENQNSIVILFRDSVRNVSGILTELNHQVDGIYRAVQHTDKSILVHVPFNSSFKAVEPKIREVIALFLDDD
ncbi:MAG: hypothetical protein JWO00_478 [Candidatus Parcubacteria bacterium]|nr:hypothetical protein [Candidatus Parcubacteria bacterium]